MRYGNQKETNYLIIFKYLFVSLSSLFCIWYTLALDRVPEHLHTVEQKQLQALVVLLIFFNDPLYLAEIMLRYCIFPIIAAVFHASFIAYLLFFWLILLDHIRLQAREQRINIRAFYPAKAIFICVFWQLSVLLYCYNIEELALNPAFKTKYNSTLYAVFKVLGVIAVVGYLTWIFVMTLLLFTEIRSMNYRFQFMLLFSLVMALMTLVGVVLSFHQLAHPNMGEWTGFYAIFNFYIYTLGYLYSPVPQSDASVKDSSSDGIELMRVDDSLDLDLDDDIFLQLDVGDIGDAEVSPGRLSPNTLKLAGEMVGDGDGGNADIDCDVNVDDDFANLESSM